MNKDNMIQIRMSAAEVLRLNQAVGDVIVLTGSMCSRSDIIRFALEDYYLKLEVEKRQ